MSIRNTVIKLVVFVAVCTVFTLYLAFTIGNIHPFQATYRLSATFDDVTGMLPEDNVKIAGVVVGKVTGIHIDQGRARVTFVVRRGVKVPTDTTAAVRWRNLLGQRYLYLYPGTASTTLRSGDHIDHTQPVVDVGELFNRLGPVVKAIDPKQTNEFLDALVGALDGNQQKVRDTIDDLAVVAKSLGERDDAIGRLIVNLDTVTGAITDRDQQIRVILDNLLAVARTFSANTDTLDAAVTNLGDFSRNFGTLLADNRAEIDRTIANLNELVQEIGTKLPLVDHALGGLDETAKRLFDASRYGEWLNQVIPCGAIGQPPVIDVQDPCVTGASSLSSASHAGGRAAAAHGMDGILQLLGAES